MKDFDFGFHFDALCQHQESSYRELCELRRLVSDLLYEQRQPTRRTLRFWPTQAVAAGAMTIECEPVAQGFCWLIERVAYFCNSTTPTEATLYLDAVDPLNMADYTNVGNKIVSDQAQPIFQPAGSRLVAQWTGVTAPASPVAKLRVQYRIEPMEVFREVPATMRELVGAPA